MLDRYQPHATIAVSDLERAKARYADKLGLEPTSEDVGGLRYENGRGQVHALPDAIRRDGQNTVMEWTVDDVAEIVDHLKSRGVVFDTFEMEGVTWEGEIASMAGRKGAWFKDSEGNILAVTR